LCTSFMVRHTTVLKVVVSLCVFRALHWSMLSVYGIVSLHFFYSWRTVFDSDVVFSMI
jgi:hypothetical protein